MRFLTTRQIARLFFSSRWAANKRLRRLFDAGLVRVWLRSLAEENVYSITRAGLKIVREAVSLVESSAAPRIPRLLDGNLEHLLAINQVRIALALALPEASGELCWWQSDWELGARRYGRVSPDARFAIRWEGEAAEHVLSLELERDTSGPRSLLTKLMRYRSLRHTARSLRAASEVAILVVGLDAERVERCRSSFAHLGMPIPIWFSTLGDLDRRAAGAIWKRPGDNRGHSLRALSSLPYRKEGFETENAEDSTRSAAESARISPLQSRRNDDGWPSLKHPGAP